MAQYIKIKGQVVSVEQIESIGSLQVASDGIYYIIHMNSGRFIQMISLPISEYIRRNPEFMPDASKEDKASQVMNLLKSYMKDHRESLVILIAGMKEDELIDCEIPINIKDLQDFT